MPGSPKHSSPKQSEAGEKLPPDQTRAMAASDPWIPLYLQIQATLKERIVSGQYEISSLLPTEAELCTEFKASRYTIREALRGLSEQGFVHRRQRTGTVVLTRTPQVTYTQSVRSIEDLFQIATETHYVLLDVQKVVLDDTMAPRVGGLAGEEWICVIGMRWDKPGGTPICYIHSYVPARFASVVEEFPETKGPFYGLLEKRGGEPIEEVVQEINAAPMPAEMVKALGLESGSLSLLLLRRYTTKSGTIIASFNWHRADQFTYRMQLHRRTEGMPLENAPTLQFAEPV